MPVEVALPGRLIRAHQERRCRRTFVAPDGLTKLDLLSGLTAMWAVGTRSLTTALTAGRWYFRGRCRVDVYANLALYQGRLG